MAPLLLGLGVALFLLTASLHYLLLAFGASQAAERRALEFEIASREAELRALRAQIHPHFLFNSLNSINALIASQPEEARRLCVRMADFLRRSLTVGSREAIPLAEELDLAEQLLSIERVRFGERLSHTVVADEAARACAVPPLLLQPLVENAVTHGIAQTIEGGEIRIEAERRGPELRITISNPRDTDAPGRKGTGIGLQNVRRRLLALHKDDADVRVLPGDTSFRVELRLPARLQEARRRGPMLDSGREDAVDRLRGILDAHGYAGPEATAALGAPIGPEHRPADLPLYRRRLAKPTPLHALIQLFALHQAVPEAEARRAFDPRPDRGPGRAGAGRARRRAMSGRSSRWRSRRGSSWPSTARTRSLSPSSRTTCSG